MAHSVMDLRSIASAGGGMILDASKYSCMDLKSIASAAGGMKAQLTLRNLSHLSVLDLRAIASAGTGCVVLDFLG
jgi:hypothetical protein